MVGRIPCQSLVSPKSTRLNNTSMATFTLPNTVVVVAEVTAITLLCTQLYTAAQGPVRVVHTRTHTRTRARSRTT